MPVFLNSVPKSGTHLLKQIMSGIPGMQLKPYEFYEGYPQDLALHEAGFTQLKDGDFAAGHVYYSPEYAAMLKRNRIKQVFLTRDLRDIVVSYVYFIVGPYPDHPLREYLLLLDSRKEQFLALIRGVQLGKFRYPDIGTWYGQFRGWIGQDDVCWLTFERLTASEAARRQALDRLLRYALNGRLPPASQLEAALDEMERRIDPSTSLTYRKGVSGEWRHEFDDEVKAAFKQVAGPWLIVDGYEKDDQWQ
ncbi:hypothetical protein COLU111180_13420 [Cohnella lubricantis]